MGHIYLQSFGDGTASVSDVNPVNNQRVYLHCTPYSGASLDRIVATDSYDHSIALLQVEEQSFIFRDSWNNMYIEVYFSNSPTPPPPTPPQLPLQILLCLLASKKKGKRYVR